MLAFLFISLFICCRNVVVSVAFEKFFHLAESMRCILWPMNLVSSAILRCEHNHKINKLRCQFKWEMQNGSSDHWAILEWIDHFKHVSNHFQMLCAWLIIKTTFHSINEHSVYQLNFQAVNIDSVSFAVCWWILQMFKMFVANGFSYMIYHFDSTARRTMKCWADI